MGIRRRLCPFAVVVGLIALSAAGCGQWSPSLPTSPSGLPSALDSVPSSGATIQGRVTGAGVGISPSSVSTPFGTSIKLTVKIVGANISAPVSSSGAFVLEGVPAGTIQLQFTGGTGDPVASLGTVNTGDRLDVQISLTGTVAVVDAFIRIKADSATEVEGNVAAVSGTCPNLSLVVNGWTLKVDGSSQGGCADIKVGVKVKIKGTLTSTKVVVVVRIEIAGHPPRDDADHPGDDDDHDSDGDSH